MTEIRTIPGRDRKVEIERIGDGAPLVYLHGAFGLEWSMPLLNALAERRTVYAPHLPGYGGSDGLEDIDSFYDLSVWLDEVLDLLGLETVALAGHDFGGAAAAEYAALFRRRTASLALLAPLGLWLDDAPMPDVFGLTPGALTRALFADGHSEAAAAFNATHADRALQNESILRRRQALIAAAKLLWPLPDKGLAKRLYRIKAPTLLVSGRNDRLTGPGYTAAFEASIAGSRVVAVDSGHMLPQEAASPSAKALLAFLDNSA